MKDLKFIPVDYLKIYPKNELEKKLKSDELIAKREQEELQNSENRKRNFDEKIYKTITA